MNKTTKGALAAGAAALLLLGGAGSYALWSDTEQVTAGTIQTGDLDIQALAAGVWTDHSADVSGAPVVSPATFKMVPGDVLWYDATFKVVASGDNLKAQIVPDQDSITRGPGLTAANTPVTTTTTLNGQALVGSVIASTLNNQTVAVRIALSFDPLTANRDGVNSTVGLGNFRVKLEQVRP